MYSEIFHLMEGNVSFVCWVLYGGDCLLLSFLLTFLCGEWNVPLIGDRYSSVLSSSAKCHSKYVDDGM